MRSVWDAVERVLTPHARRRRRPPACEFIMKKEGVIEGCTYVALLMSLDSSLRMRVCVCVCVRKKKSRASDRTLMRRTLRKNRRRTRSAGSLLVGCWTTNNKQQQQQVVPSSETGRKKKFIVSMGKKTNAETKYQKKEQSEVHTCAII